MRRMLMFLGIVLLGAGLSGSGFAQRTGNGQQSTQSSKATTQGNPADYVGSETCAGCHSELADKLASNPHAKIATERSGPGTACESCHGPGKEHVDGGGDVTKIRRFDSLPPDQVNATCLTCHAGKHANFEQSKHAESGVSCTSCHSVHHATTTVSLLKIDQPKLCFTCHSNVKPQFNMPFHHQVEEGLMKCSDCHDPHGTFQDKQLLATTDQNAICTKCHTDTAGPFVYEHPVVKTRGCLSCHMPHGSPNPRMLRVGNVNTLCLQCHSAVNLTKFPNAVSEQGGPVYNQALQYVSCTTCHTQIHGSNAAYNFFR